jgi:hypothetical protein
MDNFTFYLILLIPEIKQFRIRHIGIGMSASGKLLQIISEIQCSLLLEDERKATTDFDEEMNGTHPSRLKHGTTYDVVFSKSPSFCKDVNVKLKLYHMVHTTKKVHDCFPESKKHCKVDMTLYLHYHNNN